MYLVGSSFYLEKSDAIPEAWKSHWSFTVCSADHKSEVMSFTLLIDFSPGLMKFLLPKKSLFGLLHETLTRTIIKIKTFPYSYILTHTQHTLTHIHIHIKSKKYMKFSNYLFHLRIRTDVQN